MWFAIELRDNPVKNNPIIRIKFKGKVSKNYMYVFWNHGYKDLGLLIGITAKTSQRISQFSLANSFEINYKSLYI